jgi:hypothetical protein
MREIHFLWPEPEDFHETWGYPDYLLLFISKKKNQLFPRVYVNDPKDFIGDSNYSAENNFIHWALYYILYYQLRLTKKVFLDPVTHLLHIVVLVA